MDRFVENLRDEMLRTGRIQDGQWIGSFVGIKLPTECGRCRDSFFAEDVGTEDWYWLDVERDGTYVPESVCSHCLTPVEEEELRDAARVDPLMYTLALRE